MAGDKHATTRRRRMAFAAWIIVFFVGISIAVYIRSPLAKVKAIVVQGAVNLSVSQILNDTGITVGESLFQVPATSAEHRLLADYPILYQAVSKRNFISQKVIISLREKVVAGILAVNGTLYRILTDGTVLDKDTTGVGVSAPIITTSSPVSVSLGEKLTDPSLLSICSQLPGLPLSVAQQLSELQVENFQENAVILAFTRDGYEIRMPVQGIAGSMALYEDIHQKLLRQHIAPGLIDVMNGHTAVYQPYQSTVAKG